MQRDEVAMVFGKIGSQCGTTGQGLLVKTEGSRIVNVSSEAHRFCRRLDVTDLSFDRTRTEKQIFGIYGVTKLCNLLFTRELAAKLAASFGDLSPTTTAALVALTSSFKGE